MGAGKFRHIITIQQKSVVRTAAGGATESWTTFVECRAKHRAFQGREHWDNAQENSEANVRFYIRLQDGITANMRVLFNGQYYNIVDVYHDYGGTPYETVIMTTRYSEAR